MKTLSKSIFITLIFCLSLSFTVSAWGVLDETRMQFLIDAYCYLYDDAEINALLTHRIAQEKGREGQRELFRSVVIMPALLVRDGAQSPSTRQVRVELFVDQLRTRIGEEGAILLPINLNENHWVGLVIRLDNQGRAVRIQYIDPRGVDLLIPSELAEGLELVYGNEITIERVVFLLQAADDRVSCGPLIVENLIRAVINSTIVGESEVATVGESEVATVGEAEVATVGEAEVATIDGLITDIRRNHMQLLGGEQLRLWQEAERVLEEEVAEQEGIGAQEGGPPVLVLSAEQARAIEKVRRVHWEQARAGEERAREARAREVRAREERTKEARARARARDKEQKERFKQAQREAQQRREERAAWRQQASAGAGAPPPARRAAPVVVVPSLPLPPEQSPWEFGATRNVFRGGRVVQVATPDDAVPPVRRPSRRGAAFLGRVVQRPRAAVRRVLRVLRTFLASLNPNYQVSGS
jgi:hypothetical protein